MGLYTASLWTLLTSSATIPPFDPDVYTLKATIDDTGHQMPGAPYTYPINITQGQNLYTIYTAPSGAVVTEILCLSGSYRIIGSGNVIIRYSLRSGSCAASGSHSNNTGQTIQVYYTVVDDNNNYYYGGPINILEGTTYGTETLQLTGDYDLASLTLDAYSTPPGYYIIGECGACGQPNFYSFDEPYVVVQPLSITSSTFPAEIVLVSGSKYGAKISSSADGLFANTDIEIGWNVIGDTPIYYTGSFGSTYYSTAISASVQRNDCSSGYEGSYVLYTLPASQSSATSSQVDAQNAAQAYFNSTSQSYANTYGSCIATGSTVDVYAKFIDTEATLQYSINAGSPVVIDVIDSLSCGYWVQIVCNAGDTITFDTTGTNAISGNDTGPCPSTAAGCAYYYIVNSGANSVYITVDGSLSC